MPIEKPAARLIVESAFDSYAREHGYERLRGVRSFHDLVVEFTDAYYQNLAVANDLALETGQQVRCALTIGGVEYAVAFVIPSADRSACRVVHADSGPLDAGPYDG